MPYPNEHSCRVREPSQFQKGSFRRIEQGKLSIIIGRLKGKTTTTTQAFRYPKGDWSVDSARAHCKRNDGRFEPAGEMLEAMHPDFQKIKDQFVDRYGEDEGLELFDVWVKKRKLDTSKPYSTQAQMKESFQWAKPLFKLFNKDKEAKYYKVEAGFPVNSMNKNIYTEKELLRATSSLPGKHVDLNHYFGQIDENGKQLPDWTINGVEITAANYEDGAVETILRVLNNAVDAKGRNIQQAIDSEEIDHVSIEADCEGAFERTEGYEPVGLEFTGLGLLDQEALPGIPLTRLRPLESLQESIFDEVKTIQEKNAIKETPKTDEQRAMNHFKITPDEWVKLSDEEKQEYIDKLPPAGSARETVELQEKIAELQREKADLTDAQRKLVKEKDDVEATLKVRSDELEESKKTIVKLQKEKVDILKDKANHKKNLDEAYKELSETKQSLAELQGKYDSLTADFEEEKQQVEMRDKTIKDKSQKIGKLTENLAQTKRKLNDASANLARSTKEALNETEKASEIQKENAVLSEENATKTREISELSRVRAELAKKVYRLETEIAETKKEIQKRDDVINKQKKLNEKALKIQKRLYKTLQQNGIYEVDEEGNLIVH